MISIILLSSAMAGDVHAVPAGKSEVVAGPAVWMTEDRFTRMLMAEEVLPACEEALKESVEEGIASSRRASEAFSLAKAQFAVDEDALAEAQRMVLAQAVQLRVEREKNARLREQRNVAWGIAGGFLAASAAAVVLAVN